MSTARWRRLRCLLGWHGALRFERVIGSLAEVRCGSCAGHWLTKEGDPYLLPWDAEIEAFFQNRYAVDESEVAVP